MMQDLAKKNLSIEKKYKLSENKKIVLFQKSSTLQEKLKI